MPVCCCCSGYSGSQSSATRTVCAECVSSVSIVVSRRMMIMTIKKRMLKMMTEGEQES